MPCWVCETIRPKNGTNLATHRTAFKNLKVLGSNPAPARGECVKKIDSVFESERSAWLGLRSDSPQGRHKLAAHRTVLKGGCKLWVATAGLMSLMAVQGGTVSWVGGSGDWSDTNHWSTGALPGANDDIIINPANTLALSGGSTLTNPTLGLGNNGTTMAPASPHHRRHVNVTTLNLGSTAGGLGLLTLQSNALVNVQSNLTVVSGSLVATSSVTLNGGSFTVLNGLTQIGSSGNGLLTISAGNHTFRQITLGSTNGLGSGGFHFLGGHVTLLGTGTGPGQGLNSNWILWEGGDLDGSGTSLTIANGNNSTVIDSRLCLECLWPVGLDVCRLQRREHWHLHAGVQQQRGGHHRPDDSGDGGLRQWRRRAMSILSGGTLYVTNATHTANLDVRNGTFTLGPGATLVVDNLILNSALRPFYKATWRHTHHEQCPST